MSRRSLMAVFGSIILVGTAAVTGVILAESDTGGHGGFDPRAAYVELSPGPAYDAFGVDAAGQPIVRLSGHSPLRTHGKLLLPTVVVGNKVLTGAEAANLTHSSSVEIVPEGEIYSLGTADQSSPAESPSAASEAGWAAESAAACYLGYPVGVEVISPAPGVVSSMRAGDRLVSIDGHATPSNALLRHVLSAEFPGRTVPAVIERAGRIQTVHVRMRAPLPGRRGASIGVAVSETCIAPYTAYLGGAEVTGPSSGLAYALAIVSVARGDDLTYGMTIAVTGTIDQAGRVGAVAGIRLKELSAVARGASVFVVPADNCRDVDRAAAGRMRIVKVSSLANTVTALDEIGHGHSAPSC